MEKDGKYTIRVAGRLAPHWAAEFEGLQIECNGDGTTALCGAVPDQSALHGHLRRIERLGLTLISLNRGDS